MTLPAVLDDRGRPLDRITLRGVSAVGRHGVLAAERRDGQTFVVDVFVYLDTRAAAADDELAATADYGALAVLVADMVRGEPVDLIETLAHRLALACLAAVPAAVPVVDITVHKPHAPIPGPFADVAATVRRHRDELPGRAPA